MGGDSSSARAPLNQWRHDVWKHFQYYLDQTTHHPVYRWVGFFVSACLYSLRVHYLQEFYSVSYLLGMYILNLLNGFLSPLVDPELLPSDGPFIRLLPEFKFWYAITKVFLVSFVMTFFSMFDVPVFWPKLLYYFWIFIFVLFTKRHVAHMMKYKYIPFNILKQKYGGKRSAARNSGSLAHLKKMIGGS